MRRGETVGVFRGLEGYAADGRYVVQIALQLIACLVCAPNMYLLSMQSVFSIPKHLFALHAWDTHC